MDMLKSFASGGDSDKPGSENSSLDLFAKAKLVADAAQSTFGNEPDKVDKPKVASAAADLIDAGEKYGKIDSTSSMGQYLDKAEDYLHKYGSSAAPAAGAQLADAPAEEAEKPAPPPAEAPAAELPAETPAAELPAEVPAAEPPAEAPAAEPPAEALAAELPAKKEEESGSGYGDVIKMAGGFFK